MRKNCWSTALWSEQIQRSVPPEEQRLSVVFPAFPVRLKTKTHCKGAFGQPERLSETNTTIGQSRLLSAVILQMCKDEFKLLIHYFPPQTLQSVPVDTIGSCRSWTASSIDGWMNEWFSCWERDLPRKPCTASLFPMWWRSCCTPLFFLTVYCIGLQQCETSIIGLQPPFWTSPSMSAGAKGNVP